MSAADRFRRLSDECRAIAAAHGPGFEDDPQWRAVEAQANEARTEATDEAAQRADAHWGQL